MATTGTVSVFENGPPGSSGLDSLAIYQGAIWAEYGNGASSTGGSGSSTLVDYNLKTGQEQDQFTVAGSVDGLKIDPNTGVLWALQNQDGNSTLTLIDLSTGQVSTPFSYAPPYVYGANSTRGYDDVAFIGQNVYLSYTNPVNPGDPVLQQLVNGGDPVGPLITSNLLSYGAVGTNLETGQLQAIPLNDPDSLKATPGGGLVLTSGSDNAFTLIDNPGAANQSVSFVQLQNLPAGSSLDDVIIPSSSAGTLYISNAGTNQIEKVAVSGLLPGQAIVSVGSEVGVVDESTGIVTPLVSGLSGSHGLAFVAEPTPTVISQSVFATPPHGASSPDSLTLSADGSLWVEYSNGASSTGGGGHSTIVEYSNSGTVEQTYTIRGSVDGLKVDPLTGDVWALQNQDANSTLTLIDPATGQVTHPLKYAPPYVYGAGSTRGYDDVAFDNGKVFLSYTNPANPGDSVVQELLNGNSPFGSLQTSSILALGDTGTNLETGQTNQPLPLNDPDSLKTLPDGSLLLTSDNDAALVIIRNPGTAQQHASFIQLPPGSSGLDDAIMPTATSGTFYVSSSGANQVVQAQVTGLNTHDIYLSLSSSNAIVQVDPQTGAIVPVVTGLSSPHGLAFVPSSGSVQQMMAHELGAQAGLTVAAGTGWAGDFAARTSAGGAVQDQAALLARAIGTVGYKEHQN